jgi:poly-beta-1,6-N-acetyl-D-glucosamine N-deacetylase
MRVLKPTRLFVATQYRPLLIRCLGGLGVGLGVLVAVGGWREVNPLSMNSLSVPNGLAVPAVVGDLPTDLRTAVADFGIFPIEADPVTEIPPGLLSCLMSDLTVASQSQDYSKLSQKWVTHLQQGTQESWSTWRSTLSASMQQAPWPEIHERAKAARVPVIMYHDVLSEKEVFFDITPEQLEADFQLIRDSGLTPISLDQLVMHLRTGLPLPDKPIVLTFDDGYVGHYDTVFQLLRRYRYPAAFSIFTGKPDGQVIGRSTLSWEQLQVMAAHPLVTIVAHSLTHPSDLRLLPDDQLAEELQVSKQRLEEKLGIPIRYFTYPEGNRDERVVAATQAAGYSAALAMDNISGDFANASTDLLNLERFGSSRLAEVIETAWGGPPLPRSDQGFNFNSPIRLTDLEVDDVPITLIAGGQPTTIHADSRYPLAEMVAGTDAIAAVDGTFFSLELLDSRIMIGPVLSRNTGEFIPGGAGDIQKLKGRPLVLINTNEVKFIPFQPEHHNHLGGIQQAMPDVTDAFVAAVWLVQNGQAPSLASFKQLPYFEDLRHRAFWGINQAGQPMIGVTHARVDTPGLSQRLAQVGFRDAVMLDSGISTSLVYQGESLMSFEPRPVPHAVILTSPNDSQCANH